MSLIHDALRSIDAPAAPLPARVRTPGVGAAPAPVWRSGVLAFVLVLATGLAAWAGWRWWVAATALPPPPPSLSAPPPAGPSVPPAAAPVLPLPSPVALPPATGSTADVRLEPAPAASAVLAENLKQKRSLAQSGQRIVALKKEKPETSQAAEPPALTGETRLVRFMEALAAGRTEQAGQELAALRQLWPAGTLGLVRAQAWYDLQTGRDAAAAHGYRTLLERLPGDEEAAINLASVLWRLHGPEEARGVLAEAARVNPESVGLQSALGRFTPGARH